MVHPLCELGWRPLADDRSWHHSSVDGRVEATVACYDAVVEDYVARNARATPDLEAFRGLFASSVGAGGFVVDLGCGPGRDCRALARNGIQVAGMDLSVEMLRQAVRGHVAVVRGDLRRPPLRDASADGIWSAASLLHVPSEDLTSTLFAWRRVLRPGGQLGLSTSIGGDEGWELTPYDSSRQRARSDLQRWFVHHDEEPLLAALAEAGFSVISTAERASHRRWLQILAAAT